MPDDEIVTPEPIDPLDGPIQDDEPSAVRGLTRKQLIAMGAPIKPLTREEHLLEGTGYVTPLNVKEQILNAIVGGGGGGGGGGIEGLSKWETVVVTVVNGSTSKYIGFNNAFAGSDVSEIAFYDKITSKELTSNGYNLYFPISDNTMCALVNYSTYGSGVVTPSATDIGHESVSIGTFTGTAISSDVVAVMRTLNDAAPVGLTFTFS